MELLKGVFNTGLGMGTGAVSDTVKLVVIGGTVETARRVARSSWNSFLDSFFLTAHFTQNDTPYEWIMHWLSKQPAWGRSREFDITTRTVRKGAGSAGDFEDEDEEATIVKGNTRSMIAFMPAQDTTHTIYYRGHWLRITRSKRASEYGNVREIKISVVARNNTVIKQLVLEAKKMYEKDAEHRIHVYIPETWGGWRWNGSRQKRPLDSVVLESSVKDMLVSDCKDFMNSEDWYAERGIPYRRGYLLYGVPGSGKSSLVAALAGELDLNIYALSLSAKGMSDNTLMQLMGRIPTRCIVLLEDLDASFTHSTTRDKKSTGAPTVSEKATEPDGNTLTLSGLLNAIDGVTAPEGRILIATTNHIDRLDEALRRPGRMDVWINFKHATKWQAEGIFKRFFPIKPKVSSGLETPVSPSSSPTSPAHQLPALRTALADEKLQKSRKIPLNALDEDELNELAHRFGQLIPEDEVSVAALQGYLLKNKSRPRECVDEVSAWIVEERERKEKLKKEKEEKERKEKEEQEKKEKEEETKKAEEEETKKADELAAARKAYRKAKRAATTAKTTTESTSTTTETGLQTPPAEDSTATSSTATESADESSSGEESSSADDDKKKKRRKAKSKSGKDKWVAVSKATAAEESPAETKAEETNDAEEDTSAVDALVDAATQISTEQTA